MIEVTLKVMIDGPTAAWGISEDFPNKASIIKSLIKHLEGAKAF